MTPNQPKPDFKKQRLEQLFAECQEQIIGNIIGPFGLSTAMFEDKSGGNVTTLHNFERADDNYVATSSDKLLHANSKEGYERKQYTLDQNSWDTRREDKIKAGVDEYTGARVTMDGMVQLADGSVKAELDHVVPIHEVHHTPKNHLALGQVTGGDTVDVTKIKDMVNHDNNLALTNQSLNRSKKAQDLDEWMDGTTGARPDTRNAEHFDVNSEQAKAIADKAKMHMEDTADKELLKKQAKELALTGGQQALQMGLRQSLGMLLAELVNSLFNELKQLIKNGVEAGKSLIADVIARMKRVCQRVASRFKDAMSAFFEGGISGFMSNLLTFLINNVVSTSKKFVRMIREGLLGLFKALKMLFFPPANMTRMEALQAGLKLMTATVMTAAGILLEESLKGFIAAFPLLLPIADILSAVLIGIVTGILTALLAYQIDLFFHGITEQKLDELMLNEHLRNQLAHTLVDSLMQIKQNQIHINKRVAQIEAINASTNQSLDEFERLLWLAKENK
ncbi:MAG: hypothetical protein AABY68_12785 [Pseudomonadota bacterium]